jgi:hypothetical protein
MMAKSKVTLHELREKVLNMKTTNVVGKKMRLHMMHNYQTAGLSNADIAEMVDTGEFEENCDKIKGDIKNYRALFKLFNIINS